MMSHGPTIIYDKSVIEGLSKDAAYWLHHHFHVVIAPPLLIEVIGNLKKNRDGRAGEELVASIASHMPSYAVTPTIDYRELFTNELVGHEVELGRRPYLGGGRRIRAADGRVGVFFDEAPEATALRRWVAGDFSGLERAMADQWHDSLRALDLSVFKQQLKTIKGLFGKTPAPETVLSYVDNSLNGEQYRTLLTGLEIMDTPKEISDAAIRRWKLMGRPNVKRFAPYLFHLIRVELFFAFLIATDVISDGRPKHRADFLYLYYLPFTSIFVSNDKLHIQMAPLLMETDQLFIQGETLREDMKRLADYYKSLPQAVRDTGTSTYAEYPPREGNFLTSEIYDRFQPNWRLDAAVPKKPITAEENKKIMAGLKPIMDAISAVDRKGGA
jgi:hypothetical protein